MYLSPTFNRYLPRLLGCFKGLIHEYLDWFKQWYMAVPKEPLLKTSSNILPLQGTLLMAAATTGWSCAYSTTEASAAAAPPKAAITTRQM